jgi:hypothetical protein
MSSKNKEEKKLFSYCKSFDLDTKPFTFETSTAMAGDLLGEGGPSPLQH